MKGFGTAASAAAILLAGAGGAFAADMGLPVKAVPVGSGVCTSIMDFFTTACQVSAYGVRFYGTIDIGATYETHGAPTNQYLGNNAFLQKANNGAKFLANPNGLSASNIGVQIKENIGGGWSFVGQLEAGFQPFSMDLLNGVHSIYAAAGTPLLQQTAFGDSNSQGQFYNDLGFFGFSNDTWGTLTFFRQNDLMMDAALSYDPMGVSGTFSPLGFFGSFTGGGDTQNRRDTTAIKYRVNIANWHLAAYGQLGGYNEGNASKGGAQGDLGADFHIGPGLLSLDGIVGWKKDAVSLGNGLSGPTNPDGTPKNPTVGGINTQFLNSIISNNTSVMALAKYQVDRWKLFAGYEHVDYANPSDPQTGFTDIAGDLLCQNCNGLGGIVDNGTQIVNNFYTIHKIDQLAWVGARYSVTSSLDVTGAYYHEWQNDFSGDPAPAAGAFNCVTLSTSSGKCQGTRDTISAVADWQFAPKWDTYLGVNYNWNSGADLNGYLQKNVFSTTGGLRFRW